MEWTEEQIAKAKEDFRVFIYMVWKMISLPDPTPIQYDIAHTLQNLPNDRFIIEGFRGVAKSFITCAYAVWTLWRDPQKKVEIVSASKDRADANAIFIKRIIYTLPFLAHLKARPDQRDQQNLFDVGPAVPDISPSIKSVGISGQLTGSRADLLIADDVEVANNSGTQTQRDKLNEAVKEFDAIIKPKGQIVYLGTPQNEMSLYNELQQRGYRCRIWTVLYPESLSEREFYGDRLAKIIADKYDNNPELYAGKPTDPRRFDEEEIYKRRLSYGKAGFALQFMLNTNLSDQEKYPLKVQDLMIANLSLDEANLKWYWSNDRQLRINDLPCVALKGDYFYEPQGRSNEVFEYTGTVMAVDPSGRGKDETSYAVVKYLNGYLFVLEVGGTREGYNDSTLRQLANKAKIYGVNEIVVEGNFGDGMFSQLFKPVLNDIHPCSVTEVKNYAQKEARIIDTLEPVMMRHKLIIHKQVILDDYQVYENAPAYSLIYQMTRLSRDRGALAHDDRLDALCMAVAYWLAVMDRDEEIGMQEQIEAKLEQWLNPDKGIFYRDETNQMRPMGRSEAKRISTYNMLKNY
ncbi:phage terminase large subunit [Veillonella atypica]|uniref:DNA maturase B n=1 Tax=Veillonella atypica TaxID=39777 RepID=A0A3A6W2V7_9FIRM|nr:phage terminase large subunit [Veillonella atypica]RJY49959.1 DNA maturase B [Veillonella atypica]